MNWHNQVQNDDNCFFNQLLYQCQEQHESNEIDFKKELFSHETDFLGHQEISQKQNQQMWAWDQQPSDFSSYEGLIPNCENQLVRVKSLRMEQEDKISNFLTKQSSDSTTIPKPEKTPKNCLILNLRKKKKIQKSKKSKDIMPRHKF